MTIVDFLLARIAEDEAAVERSRRHNAEEVYANDNYGCLLVDPMRVLAECQAKRAIVALHKPTTLEDLWGAARADIAKRLVCEYDSSPDSHLGDTTEWPCTTLRHLAAVYADHPDYRQEWRP